MITVITKNVNYFVLQQACIIVSTRFDDPLSFEVCGIYCTAMDKS